MKKKPFRRMLHALTALCLAAALTPNLGVPKAAAANANAADSPAPPPVVFNAGFEEPSSGPVIPGWTQTFGVGGSDLHFEATSEEAYEGSKSLLLDNRNTSMPLGVESDRFPVQPGASYSVSSMMKVEQGSMALYVRFFDVGGTKVGESSNWQVPTNGQWVKNATTAVIPSNAETATVMVYFSRGITRGYADQIRIEPNRIGTFERIGGVVKGMINEDVSIGTENGKAVMYTVFKGRSEVPTSFAVIDLLTREVLRTYPMPGVEAAWAVLAAKDGSVYIGSHYDGGLYRYKPGDQSFSFIGRYGSETHVFSLAEGKDGIIYAGTYPGGKVFSYDPASGAITDLGVFDPEQKYGRSLAYDAERDVLYIGIGGTKSRIYKVTADGTRKELLGGLIPGGGDTHGMPYGMSFAEDRLFVKFNNGNILVIRAEDDGLDYYNPSEGSVFHSEKAIAIPDEPGKVLFTRSGSLHVYDTSTKSHSLYKPISGGINFQGAKYVDLGSPEWPGLTLTAGANYGKILYYNPATGRAEVHEAKYSGAPTLIQSIHQGSDGNMYVAGYMSGFASYNPVTGEISETNTLGQVESSVIRNGRMILGAYAGARILEFDPSLPYSSRNPRQLFDLRAHSQDRPFAMAYAEDRDQLFIGTVPNSTSLQGALAMYDFETGQLDVFRNIIRNQGIVSIVYKDGLIYAGTTIYGGLGTSGPTETNGKLFIFDPATKTKVYETTPMSGRKGVTGLHIGPDGMIWGIAEDTIFRFNPETRQFVSKIAKLRRYGSGTTWTWGFLQTGADGNVYGTSRGQFFMVKPETNEFLMLNASFGNYLNRDSEGNLYFSDNSSDLWKYTPPTRDTEPPTVTLNVYDGAHYLDAEELRIQVNAVDHESGVDAEQTVILLDGQPITNGAVIPLYTLPLGVHTIEASARDLAGNVSVVTVTFSTSTSVDSLKALISRFVNDGLIKEQGIANSLLAKLESGSLQAFVHELTAQQGKHISTEAADVLLRDAANLLKS